MIYTWIFVAMLVLGNSDVVHDARIFVHETEAECEIEREAYEESIPMQEDQLELHFGEQVDLYISQDCARADVHANDEGVEI